MNSPRKLTLTALAGLCILPAAAYAHDMMYIGQGSDGHLKIFIEDGLLPDMMIQSTYPEIDGWVQTEFGFETVIGDDPDLDMHPLSSLSNIQVVLLAADEGVQLLKDGFEGPLQVGEGYTLGNPYFHLHPIWNIYDVSFDRLYSMTFVVHDTTGTYPDSKPFTLTFKAIPCPADFDRSVFVDVDDFTAFVAAFEAGTDDADFDQSGFVDIEDFVGFVGAFEAGC